MAVETVQNEKEKIKVSPQGWLALVIMLCMFSGFFANMEGPLQFLRVLDLNTLIGSFGTIGDTGANFMGRGGAMGPMILLVIFCKLVGANIVRLIVMRNKKKNAEVAK